MEINTRRRNIDISTITKRRKLKSRNTPYYQKITHHCYLGFRKSETGSETWRARYQTSTNKYKSQTLGNVTDDFQFEEAKKAAEKFFKQCKQGANTQATVKDAVDDYLKHLKVNNSADAERRTRLQLEKHVIPTLGHVKLNKLTTKQIKDWLNDLITDNSAENEKNNAISKSSANRNLNMFKAALNLAFADSEVASDETWRRVKPFPNADESRKLFLTDKQVKTLLEKSDKDFQRLAKSALLTGCRTSELTNLIKEDFDLKRKTLYITGGKTGSRIVYLSENAVAFFKEQVKNKLPKAPIFTDDQGKQWYTKKVTREIRKTVKTAKLPTETVFYSLRHYHISKALKAGVNVQVVAENCGTSIRMIEKHYGKFLESDRSEMFSKAQFV